MQYGQEACSKSQESWCGMVGSSLFAESPTSQQTLLLLLRSNHTQTLLWAGGAAEYV